MKYEEIKENNTPLINEYTAGYFSHIFQVVISHLNMKAKRIILFTIIMLFLPLASLSDDNDTFWENETIYEEGYLSFGKNISIKLSFVLVIRRKDKKIIRSSLDAWMSENTTYTKNGNLYTIVYPNGYSSTVELVKNRIEFIEYFSVNVEIYKDKKLLHKFSTNSSIYYDSRYPNCISDVGDGSSFDTGIIQINYDKKMTNNIIDILKINQWIATIYSNQYNEQIFGDEVFLMKELCDNDKCKVWVRVKEGEEFNAVSKINGLNNGICATRGPSGAGGEIIPLAPTDEIDTTDKNNPLSYIKEKDSLEDISEYIDNLPPTAAGGKSSVDYAIEKLKDANIVFDTPSSMYRNKTYIINLKLDAVKDIEDLLKELDSAEKESAVVKYSSTMKAELIGENKNAFEITPITPNIQAISTINTTSWKWDVTPLEQGEQNLHLSLTAFLDIEGKEKALSIKTFDKVIKVNISYPDEISLFMQNNWKWILGSLLFPLVGFWWKNNHKKEEE